MTPDEILEDEILHQSLSLFRLSASQVAETMQRLKEMEDRLIRELARPLLTDAKKAEINKILSNADDIITEYYGNVQTGLAIDEVGKTVSEATVKALELALGSDAANLPTQAYFNSLASNVLIEGSPASAWWSAQEADIQFKFKAQVRQGLVNAETNQQIVARIVGKNGSPGVMDIAENNAAALVQTSVQAVANDARLETFRKNADVIAGVQQVSTLDSHTSLICIAYSGATWDLEGKPIRGTILPFNGGPPRHFNCRSVLRPITKTFREIGLNIPEPTPTTRASTDGQVSASTTFDDFLKRKGVAYQNEMLGVGRADLWRKGKITLRDLVNGRGRPLTLSELRAKF